MQKCTRLKIFMALLLALPSLQAALESHLDEKALGLDNITLSEKPLSEQRQQMIHEKMASALIGGRGKFLAAGY